MSVLYLVANTDMGESVNPYKYVNTKEPDEAPYSNFIVWLLMTKWRGDRILFIPDSEFELYEAWDSLNKTDEYWEEFYGLY